MNTTAQILGQEAPVSAFRSLEILQEQERLFLENQKQKRSQVVNNVVREFTTELSKISALYATVSKLRPDVYSEPAVEQVLGQLGLTAYPEGTPRPVVTHRRTYLPQGALEELLLEILKDSPATPAELRRHPRVVALFEKHRGQGTEIPVLNGYLAALFRKDALARDGFKYFAA